MRGRIKLLTLRRWRRACGPRGRSRIVLDHRQHILAGPRLSFPRRRRSLGHAIPAASQRLREAVIHQSFQLAEAILELRRAVGVEQHLPC